MNKRKIVAVTLMLGLSLAGCNLKANNSSTTPSTTTSTEAAGQVSTKSTTTPSTATVGTKAPESNTAEADPELMKKYSSPTSEVIDGKYFWGVENTELEWASDYSKPENVIESSVLVLKVKVLENQGVDLSGKTPLPSTTYKVNVLNVLAGETSEKELVVKKLGGDVTLNEYKASKTEKQIEAVGLTNLTEEEGKKIFYRFGYVGNAEMKVGEEYVIALTSIDSVAFGGYGIFKAKPGTSGDGAVYENLVTGKELPKDIKLSLDLNIINKYKSETSFISRGKFYWNIQNTEDNFEFDPSDFTALKEKTKAIVKVKVNEELPGMFFPADPKAPRPPYTPYKVNVEKVFYGEMEQKETEVYMYGGIVSLDKLKESLPAYNVELRGLHGIPDDDLKKMYYKEINKSFVELTKGNEYILFLGEDNTILGSGYGVYRLKTDNNQSPEENSSYTNFKDKALPEEVNLKPRG